jgi:hypothetical protein
MLCRRRLLLAGGWCRCCPPAWFLRKAGQARAIMVLRTSWN